MPKAHPHQEKRVDPFRDPSERHWSHWLGRAALVLTAALVFARATTLETIRNPLEVMPGSAAVPRGTGPAEGLWLDLLAFLPALLVLLRRVVDPTFALRAAWSTLPLLLLGAWAVASTLWSADRFAALVSSMHLFAASVLLWSTAQLVGNWTRLRLVSAVCFGLMLVMVGQAAYYRLVELPDLRAEWQRNGEEIVKERGWEPGSFEAEQFAKRVLAGELLGFTASPNSFAAVVILLSVVSGGLLAQRLARREEMTGDVAKGATLPVMALAVALLAGLAIVWMTHSRTAMAMAALAAALFVSMALLRDHLAARAKPLYFAGVMVVLLGVAAVVAYGLSTGGLMHVSMTFRWRYWVGAAGAFAANPLLGVGYENFGIHYLVHRLPIAAEEVRDPHNFVVRVVTELGLVGGVLLIAWLLRMAWELTRPTVPRDAAGAAPPLSAVGAAAAITVVGFLLSIAVSVDFTQGSAFAFLELLRRGGYACLILLGTTVGLIRVVERPEADDRPAPWVLRGCVVATGVFLVHNVVDFSFFEPGPMFLFAMVTGAAIGARTPDAVQAKRGRVLAGGTLAVGALAWLTIAFAGAVPVTIAESFAAEGDEFVRQERFSLAAGVFFDAAGEVPYNADYAFRAARAAYWAGDIDKGNRLIDGALTHQPMGVKYLLVRRAGEREQTVAAVAQVVADFAAALKLDPQNVPARLDYARALAAAGDSAAARVQFEDALRVNDQLPADETERLKPAEIAEIQAAIDKLGKS